MALRELRVDWQGDVCFLQIFRPETKNTISAELIRECHEIIDECERNATVLVLSGTDQFFCSGADLNSVSELGQADVASNPRPLYELWLKLALGSFVSVALVRGQATAGGVGFVSACDIVLADETAIFSLSELLFGLIPACVLPFLIRKIGSSKANYMTLTADVYRAEVMLKWGLIDEVLPKADNVPSKLIERLTRLEKTSIFRYKQYLAKLDSNLEVSLDNAIETNLEVFNDAENRRKITSFVNDGIFPWENKLR